MSKTASIILVGAIVALPGAQPRHAQAAGAVTGHHGSRNVLLAIPNLSADQKSRIGHLTDTAKMQTAPLREQIAAARRNLVRLWSADELDRQAISSKRGELETTMAKVRGIWADFFMQLHDVLTAPQRSWLASQGVGLSGGDAGPELGAAPKECSCGEPPRAQHPGPPQEQ